MKNRTFLITHLQYNSKFQPAEHTLPEVPFSIYNALVTLFLFLVISYFSLGVILSTPSRYR